MGNFTALLKLRGMWKDTLMVITSDKCVSRICFMSCLALLFHATIGAFWCLGREAPAVPAARLQVQWRPDVQHQRREQLATEGLQIHEFRGRDSRDWSCHRRLH